MIYIGNFYLPYAGPNGDVTYTLHPGNDVMVAKLFNVDSKSGVLTSRTSLTDAENQLFQFFVKATDGGSPALESHVPVEVLVMGRNDSPPKFSNTRRLFFVDEDEKVWENVFLLAYENVT